MRGAIGGADAEKLKRGAHALKGSVGYLNAHRAAEFALRLEKMGFSRGKVVLMAAAAAGFMGFCAFLVTQLPLKNAIAVYVLVAVLVGWVGRRMALVEM